MASGRPIDMQCPACGAVMNRHAAKLLMEADGAPDGEADIGTAPAGRVLEAFRCPECGMSAVRSAELAAG